MKKAIVFGSTGQDGSYMCELLLKKNYKVFALVRKSATGNTKNLAHLIKDKKIFEKKFFLVRGDLNDHSSIHNLIIDINQETKILSEQSLVAPYRFIGFAALSVDKAITFLILLCKAASIIFWAPRIFVAMHSVGLYSDVKTCFIAAA